MHKYLIFTLLLVLAACAKPNGMNPTPSPEQLLEVPEYKEQIRELDRIRLEEGKESIEDLIREGRVSKEPNGTEPIVVRVFPELSAESGDEESPDVEKLPEPSHDKVQVEEYFITVDVVNSARSPEPRDEKIEEGEESPQEDKADEPKISLEIREAPVEEAAPTKASGTVIEGDVPSDKPLPRPRARPEDLQKPSATAPLTSPRPRPRPSGLGTSRTSSYKADWDGYSIASLYTRYTLDGIEKYGNHLLESRLDDAGFCPSYNSLSRNQKKAFWLMVVSSISRHESGFNTNAKYLEAGGEYSRGVMQLGYSSTRQRAYSCGFRNKYELNENPEKNLHCGIKILNHWMGRDKKIRGFVWSGGERKWRGGARYWSVLRFEIWNSGKRRRMEQIRANTRTLSFCR